MSTREERVLTDVATAIGSTLGAVAAKTDQLASFMKTKERRVAKRVRGAVRHAAIARRRKTAAKKVRRVVSAGKRGLRRVAGRRKG
jgi:hypothetical protein